MDAARLSVRVAALLVALLAAAVVFVWATHGSAEPPTAVAARGGAPFAVPTQAGVFHAEWDGRPVLVFVVPAARLDGVEAARGDGEATRSVGLPGNSSLRLFVLSAWSTHLGCTVGFVDSLGASKDVADYDGDGEPDGRAMDPCAQGQWDVYRRGEPVPDTPAPRRLARLPVSIRDGQLWATGFDGPVGPAPN